LTLRWESYWGVVLLVVGFYALAWIVKWGREHWKSALIFGIPLGLFFYAAATDDPGGMEATQRGS